MTFKMVLHLERRSIYLPILITILLIAIGFDSNFASAQDKVKITVVKILASGDRSGKPKIDAKLKKYKDLLKRTAYREYRYKGEKTATSALGKKVKFPLLSGYYLVVIPRLIEKNMVVFNFEVLKGKKSIQQASGKAARFIQIIDESDIKGGDMVLIITLKKK